MPKRITRSDCYHLHHLLILLCAAFIENFVDIFATALCWLCIYVFMCVCARVCVSLSLRFVLVLVGKFYCKRNEQLKTAHTAKLTRNNSDNGNGNERQRQKLFPAARECD